MLVSRRIQEALAAVAGAGLAVGGVAIFAPQLLAAAHAEPRPACFQDPGSDDDDDYGSMSVEEQSGGSAQTSLSGVRSDVWVGSASVSCGRLNSVYVRSGSFNQLMEFGWAKGWLSCFGTASDYTNYANEIPFAVAYDGNERFCRRFAAMPLTDDTTHSFRASDTDENGYWGPWLDGSELEPSGWYLTFTQGIGGVNGERQNSNDPMYSDFNNVDENINGSWSSTDALGDPYDTDPNFHVVYDSTHDIRFVHD
jgi:hypothetical protein